MTALLDFYRFRFGTAVKQQGSAWNGPCPLCGGEPGKSDRFMVWPEKDENLGETCTRHHIAGVWSCRQCGGHGDTIAFLMEAEGMTFKAACAELGISETGRGFSSGLWRRPAPVEPHRDAWTPKTWDRPSAKWSTYAEKLVDEAAGNIWNEPDALKWLALRGIDEEAVHRYRIGYLPGEGNQPGRYRHRSALDLSPKTGDDGRVRDKIFIPRGITVPTFATGSTSGIGCSTVINLRIRRRKEDLTGRSPKYMELEGSCKAPLLLESDRPRPVAVYFVTEAELDAMLIHHISGGVVGALAVRTNRGKPDDVAHARLSEASRVCVALDFDEAGAEGVAFWTRTYATARRWPTPDGKDPGDAFRLGVDMRTWIAAGLPACVALPELPVADGHVDVCAAGLGSLGGAGNPEPLGEAVALVKHQGGEQGSPSGIPEHTPTSDKYGQERQTAATPELFAGDEQSALQRALPAYLQLTDIPADVARAWLLWRGLSVTFERHGDGFCTWNYHHTQIRHCRERLKEFFRFQNHSSVLWDWFSAHAAKKITAKNLLHLWG